ncbi:unnamed protein product, partial [marine sediment metagenome]
VVEDAEAGIEAALAGNMLSIGIGNIFLPLFLHLLTQFFSRKP